MYVFFSSFYLGKLSIWSMLANFAAVFSLGVIYFYLYTQFQTEGITSRIASLKPAESVGNISILFGAAMFSYEGITVVLPLANKTKNRKDFSMLLKIGMSIITTLYLITGTLGYIGIGDEISPSITLNLPSSGKSNVI